MPDTAPLRVVVLDGADHRVLAELLAAGRLPVLDGVRRRGVVVRAETFGGLFEEALWPSVFSGADLGDHAAQHFASFDPSDHGLRLRREPEDLEPFWLHLPDRGRGALAVDIPRVHPHPASQADEYCGWAGWSSPHRPVRAAAEGAPDLGSPLAPMHEFDHPPTLADEARFSERSVARVRERTARVGRVVGRYRVACIGVQETHGVAHVLGHHWLADHPHRPWPRQPELVTRVYEATDAALAGLVGDERANVVVLASLGFSPASSSSAALDGLLERAGLAVTPSHGDDRESPRRPLDPMSLLRRWVPADLRERLSTRFLPPATQQRLMSDKFRGHLDWSRTRMFNLPSWTTGYLRVNLAGREAFGIVDAADYDALLVHAGELVRGLRDADTDEPLVDDVIPMRRRFPGRRADELPDLAITWRLDRPARRVRHPVLGSWEADSGYHRYHWCDHHGHARAYLAGPDVVRSDEVHEVDFIGAAATFLRLAGVRPPAHLAERAWASVLA